MRIGVTGGAVAVISGSQRMMEGGTFSSRGAQWNGDIAKGGIVVCAGRNMNFIGESLTISIGFLSATILGAVDEEGCLP